MLYDRVLGLGCLSEIHYLSEPVVERSHLMLFQDTHSRPKALCRHRANLIAHCHHGPTVTCHRYRDGRTGLDELGISTTITVFRLSFKIFTDTTTQGLVLRISEPRVGSRATHQISPRSGFNSRAPPSCPSERQTLSRFPPPQDPRLLRRRQASTEDHVRQASRQARR